MTLEPVDLNARLPPVMVVCAKPADGTAATEAARNRAARQRLVRRIISTTRLRQKGARQVSPLLNQVPSEGSASVPPPPPRHESDRRRADQSDRRPLRHRW